MNRKQTPNTSIRCGRKIVAVLTGIVTVGFILGWALEHLIEIDTAFNAAWAKLLFALSFGGKFWVSATIGITMIAIIVWAYCVDENLSKANTTYSWPLIRIVLASGGIWLVSFFAMQQTFHSISDLTIYARFAVVLMTLPFLILATVAFMCVSMIMMHVLTAES